MFSTKKLYPLVKWTVKTGGLIDFSEMAEFQFHGNKKKKKWKKVKKNELTVKGFRLKKQTNKQTSFELEQ